jgi:DNA polymerase-3 subunit gamma/tau
VRLARILNVVGTCKSMSYLVLARKWRPRCFADVVGQEHVIRALSNALASDRVHHAYLFAGTRGVGKTTIARILAKALNCEAGVSAEPCGECGACMAVDEGRFVDLIEVDAASRTGVDDTRELLENVQYTPSVGRFKVYLIDEVHMLSRQSFNALLKTLEEPPPHVKFLFATTDPQKLPVTVLSRCLQFNLKRLSSAMIVSRMADICEAEGLTAEIAALKRLARAASGSMRDALSLLDQALAFGDNRLRDDDVASMLGSMEHNRIVDLLGVVLGGNAPDLIASLRELDELVPDYEGILDELATLLQRVAVLQLAGSAALGDEDYVEALQGLADAVDPEFVQLLYQIAITSRRDLSLAPDPSTGFEMAMLRMFAFRPAGEVEPARVVKNTSRAAGSQPRQGDPRTKPSQTAPRSPDELDDWPAFVAALDLEGAARQLAENSELYASSPFELRLGVARRNEHLLTDKLKERLVAAVRQRIGGGIKVEFKVTEEAGKTAAARAAALADQKLKGAQDAIRRDPQVQELLDVFEGELVRDSVRPVSRGPGKDH